MAVFDVYPASEFPHPVIRFVLFPYRLLVTSGVRLCPPMHVGPRHRNININGRWHEPRSKHRVSGLYSAPLCHGSKYFISRHRGIPR